MSSKATCLLCYEVMTLRAVSPCGHDSVCPVCVLRMRSLMKSRSCPFCKQELEAVVVCSMVDDRRFNDFDLNLLLKDEECSMFYEKRKEFDRFTKLKSISCKFCSTSKDSTRFSSRSDLITHLKMHSTYVCSICVENSHKFVTEWKYFSEKRMLQEHIRYGSQGSTQVLAIDPHPKCEFCLRLFFDKDFLYAHMEHDHFKCHICHTDGSQKYYSNYPKLFEHFEKQHFICNDFQCLDKKFIVFPNAIDLQAHQLKEHSGKGLTTSQRRNLARIDLGFQFNDFGFTFEPNIETETTEEKKFEVEDFPAMPSQSHDVDEDINVPLPFPKTCQPFQMKSKNADVLAKVSKSGKDAVSEFKSLSSMYISGMISPLEYMTAFLGMFLGSPLPRASEVSRPYEHLLMQVISLLPTSAKRMALHIEYVKWKKGVENIKEVKSEIAAAQSASIYASGVIPLSTVLDFSRRLHERTISSSLRGASKSAAQFWFLLGIDCLAALEEKYFGNSSIYISQFKVQRVRNTVKTVNTENIRDFVFLSTLGISNHSFDMLRNLMTVSAGNYGDLKDWALEIVSTMPSEDQYIISLFVIGICEHMNLLEEKKDNIDAVQEKCKIEDEFGFSIKTTKSKKKKKKKG